ncbi:MAG: P1 family peptidase [Candidatus Eremiobacteraeota bacterium]|nr:P1 family peptidase [Candidatus Eremiobacteraeota bacterium]
MSFAKRMWRAWRRIVSSALRPALLSTFLVFASGVAWAGQNGSGIRIGTMAPGPLDLITDVAGVKVGQVTKISGEGPLVPGNGPVRTGVTVVVPDDDIWNDRVAAATYDLNGNGELSGAHWVDEAGFLEVPVALTNTLNVARVDDGVIDWLIARHPLIGIRDDVPLPVVAECDDQGLNDIQGRHVSARDTVAALQGAATGTFARGGVGAGTGMRAFGFKAGIGSASRVTSRDAGTYTVGVLVNANTGDRSELRIDGVPVGKELQNVDKPIYPSHAYRPRNGRAADGSIIIVIATDAPLDHRQLVEIGKRAALGLARTGATSHVSSGDLFIAFSTTNRYPRNGPKKPVALVDDDETMNELFSATIEGTEAAIDDALFSAKTMTGESGVTLFALPLDRVKASLAEHRMLQPVR